MTGTEMKLLVEKAIKNGWTGFFKDIKVTHLKTWEICKDSIKWDELVKANKHLSTLKDKEFQKYI